MIFIGYDFVVNTVDFATVGVVLEVLERLWRGFREFDFTFLAFFEATFFERAGEPMKLAQYAFEDLEAGFAIALSDLDSDCGTAEGSVMPLAVVFLKKRTKLASLVKALGCEQRHGPASSSVFLRQQGMIFVCAYLSVRSSGRVVGVEAWKVEATVQIWS